MADYATLEELSIEELRIELREARLDNDRLRHMLAAYDPAAAPRASQVTPNGSDRLKWLETRLWGGVGMATRDAGFKILELTELLENEDRATVVEALHRMVDETDRWKDAWSASTVDHDHKLRQAMRNSESCEHHGEEIKRLSAQLYHFSQSNDRLDAARVALLELLFQLREFIPGYEAMPPERRPGGDAIISQLSRVIKKVSAAHDRAMHKEIKKA